MQVSETQPATVTAGPEPAPYEQCGQCGAPAEANQRYCVVCGFHRRHVRDPASRYMMRATAQGRSGSGAGRAVRPRRSSSLAAALLIAVVPAAVGIGVLVGRSSSNGDAKLIAALGSQRPTVITTGGRTGGSAVAASSTALSSDFPLQNGYAVEVQTVQGATNSTVTAAEHADKAKGATKVGLILQSAFRVTPAPPSGTAVIYSGAYKSQADAAKALAKLNHSFPGAKVIRVQAVTSGTAGGGRVLAHTQYGTVHQIVGFKATKAQLQQGAQVVKKIQQTQGKSYVDAQRGLPDQISVP